MNKQTILTAADAAAMLGITTDMVYLHVANGNLPTIRDGTPRLFERKTVEAFAKRRQTYQGKGRPCKQPKGGG